MQLYSLVNRTALAGLILLLSGSMIASASTSVPEPEPATGWQSKEAVFANQFMAVTAHPLATEAANTILKSGGSAVDAAVTAQLIFNLSIYFGLSSVLIFSFID